MTKESFFKGKAVLITGSTRGIGYAVAKELGKQGALLGVHGRDESRLNEAVEKLREDGCTVFPFLADLTQPENAAKLVNDFVSEVGKIDCLVNNAGAGRAVAFRGMKLDAWRDTFRTNLEAAMQASREAYVHMRKNKTGSIVNVASVSAHGPGKWMGADYAASKAGLVSMTKSLAFEAARSGIRVNAVSPGMVATDMTSALSEEMKQGLNIPLGRLAEPKEIASVIAFLLSDEADYITGQVLHVNGGLI